MIKKISGKPKYGDYIKVTKKPKLIFPLDQRRCEYYYSGRYAFAGALKSLNIKPGKKILVPAYICGIELEPIYHHGIIPIFYNVDRNLNPDLAFIERSIGRNVSAVLAIHYFGMAQPIGALKKICEEKKVALIEDCSHAFMSRHGNKPLGTFGDAAFFSLLKSIPIPNGGCLITQKKNNNNRIATRREPDKLSTFLMTADLILQKPIEQKSRCKQWAEQAALSSCLVILNGFRKGLAGVRRYLMPNALWLARSDTYEYIEEIEQWGISEKSRSIIKTIDYNEIIKTRVRNYNLMYEYFQNKNLSVKLFGRLKPGECPLLFPIILEKENKRKLVYKALKEKGIVSHPWWDRFHPKVTWEDFPDAKFLKNNLLGFPIHQNIEPIHIEKMIEAFDNIWGRI
ncbi:DegT/DnrJ/EryC1/StrS family aminotransferase [Desulfobacula toluolica]|uniref:DegT/DnrJ/EryC1/StrS aminotransferase family protein n=1 Tax=Desulfobacula toluolica (strain DSM 7467 / Tol2) TaxID=651182 RepID=K0NKK5_DESTT|nr:DegT/DnrJ/EryC1/StrS family aminotransferase [Desulfobacula toluolica]CCK80473.1 DegT/DnrJ/EryC1/StrS aminotransferase family protein [Desulfobacula toluolica Tol2]